MTKPVPPVQQLCVGQHGGTLMLPQAVVTSTLGPVQVQRHDGVKGVLPVPYGRVYWMFRSLIIDRLKCKQS
jgi:hypothetical protein